MRCDDLPRQARDKRKARQDKRKTQRKTDVAHSLSGDFAFLDQAHYSMVKTNTFNGVPLPAIWLWDSTTDKLTEIRAFSYSDFKARLS